MLADIDSEVRQIELMKSDGTRMPATLTLWTESPTEADRVELLLETEEATFSVVERDFWKALVGLREMLETKELRPVVCGASRNITASDKSIEVSHGVYAYRLTLGKLAIRQDLVNIFDVSDDVDPAYVGEQEEFARQWFDSLKPAE